MTDQFVGFSELSDTELESVDGGLCCLLGLALGALVLGGLALAAVSVCATTTVKTTTVSCAPAPSCKPAKSSKWC